MCPMVILSNLEPIIFSITERQESSAKYELTFPRIRINQILFLVDTKSPFGSGEGLTVPVQNLWAFARSVKCH